MPRLIYDPVELRNAALHHSKHYNSTIQNSAQFIMNKIKRDTENRCAATAEDGMLFVYSYYPTRTLVTFDY